MIDLAVVSSALRLHVLDTWVKRGAELSIDHNLVVSWLRWWGEDAGKTRQTQTYLRLWRSLRQRPRCGRGSVRPNDFGTASKRFWTTSSALLTLYSGDDVLLTSTKDVIDWRRGLPRVREEILPQVKEFKYLGVLFTSVGKMKQEIDRRIGPASAVMQTWLWSGEEGSSF